jgi:hypothetical protein
MSLPAGLFLKNTLNVHYTFHEILDKIHTVITSIKHFEDLKTNPELLLLVCRLIEVNLPDNKQMKLDKKDLALQIMNKLFSLTDDEKDATSKQIQFLYDNKKIKAVKWYNAIYYSVKEYIKRRILLLDF